MYLELYLINPSAGNFVIRKSMRQMLFIRKTQIYHIHDAINLIHAELCVIEGAPFAFPYALRVVKQQL